MHYSSVSTTKAKVLPRKCKVQETLTISGLSVHTCFDKNARLGALYNSRARFDKNARLGALYNSRARFDKEDRLGALYNKPGQV